MMFKGKDATISQCRLVDVLANRDVPTPRNLGTKLQTLKARGISISACPGGHLLRDVPPARQLLSAASVCVGVKQS